MVFVVTQTQSCRKNGESAESRIATTDLSKSSYFLYKGLFIKDVINRGGGGFAKR